MSSGPSENNGPTGGNSNKMTPQKRHEEGGNNGGGRGPKKPRGGRGNNSNSNNNSNNNNGNRGGGSGRGGGGRGGGRGGRGRNNRNRNHNRNNNNNKDSKNEEHKPMEVEEENVSDGNSNNNDKPAEEGKSRHQFSEVKFTSQASISDHSKRALTDVLKYEYMTKVQEATLPSILEGKDVVAKAKTGSGKTTAFLLPMVEHLSAASKRNNNRNNQIIAVVLSPTRELANQIAAEFQKLATFHPGMKNQSLTLIGGTNIDKDKRRLVRDNNIRLIIATPGRLQDHVTQNTAKLVDRLQQVEIVCLDEADRLLDMGFRQELEKILSYMPSDQRQTLLFSATFPSEIQSMAQLAMRADYELIDTLDENEGDTNVQVIQQSLIVPLQHHILAMEHILQNHIQERQSAGRDYKIIVFFTTARVAGFMAELFRADPRYPQYTDATLLEMHSRKSQSYRTNVAKKFTNQNNIVLFSSDVSARGVDYPNVTCVVQVGAPSEKAQYIHRLGRTARAGEAGIGILLLSDFEKVFLNELDDLEVTPISMEVKDNEAPEEQAHFQQLLKQTKNEGLLNSAKAAYQAFLGYYNSNIRRLRLRNKQELVAIANEFSVCIGFPEGDPPALQAKTVGKMGLQGVAGLNVERGGGGRGGRGGRR